MAAMNPYPPAWTGYKQSVTIDGNSYEELEYQFVSRRSKLTVHRRQPTHDVRRRSFRVKKLLQDIRTRNRHLQGQVNCLGGRACLCVCQRVVVVKFCFCDLTLLCWRRERLPTITERFVR